jgi:hypothetical protein
MATLTLIAGPPITVTALTAMDPTYSTFSGSGFTSLPTITGAVALSATSLQVATERISSFA